MMTDVLALMGYRPDLRYMAPKGSAERLAWDTAHPRPAPPTAAERLARRNAEITRRTKARDALIAAADLWSRDYSATAEMALIDAVHRALGADCTSDAVAALEDAFSEEQEAEQREADDYRAQVAGDYRAAAGM